MLSKKGKTILSFSTFGVILATLILFFFFFKDGFTFSLLSLLPISELRGSIPVAIFSSDWPIWVAYPAAVLLNWLVAPLVFIFLDHIHPLFCKWGFYQRVFDKFITRAREKMREKVEKYGMWGIMVFIGIPLPITGVYTGTAGAWILGLDRKKTLLAALGGVVMSGLIVSIICLLIKYGLMSESSEEFFSIFIKKPETV